MQLNFPACSGYMHCQLLPYKESVIRYCRFGKGPIPVICFHGYGENAGSFEFLGNSLGSQYTFHAIDLPYHGETVWKQGLDFSLNDLWQILSHLPLDQDSKPVLFGFSLGGRVALSLYESRPATFRKLVLLAPDGLVINPWYWLSTQTFIGNRLFRFTMKKPGWFFLLLKGMNRTGRVNASVYKFVNAYIGDPALRISLYQRWTVLRKLKPGLGHIKSLIREHKTPVRLLYGRHDRIILSSRGEKFRNGIAEYCDIWVLNAGHQVLQSKYLPAIETALK